MSEVEGATVGDIVAADFRAGAVFERFGIDFCCGRRRSVAEACRQAAVDPETVEQALRAVPPGDTPLSTGGDALAARAAGGLHRRHASRLRAIGCPDDRAVPRKARRRSRCTASRVDLHCPVLRATQRRARAPHAAGRAGAVSYLRRLAATTGHGIPASPFGTVENPIRMMEREHQEAGDEIRMIRELTHGYTPRADGCSTYRVCFAELAQFERDLHRHVHLENNVLFPKAVERERERGSRGAEAVYGG
jgi:regulator of cell morphogenesis and NO signaling